MRAGALQKNVPRMRSATCNPYLRLHYCANQ